MILWSSYLYQTVSLVLQTLYNQHEEVVIIIKRDDVGENTKSTIVKNTDRYVKLLHGTFSSLRHRKHFQSLLLHNTGYLEFQNNNIPYKVIFPYFQISFNEAVRKI